MPAPPPAPPFPVRLISPHAPKPTSVLRIVYQNVNLWETNKHSLRPAFSKVNPDVILMADTGLGPSSPIKLHPYIAYQSKNIPGIHAGVAILIRRGIEHRIIQKPFFYDTIAIRIETPKGPIIIATSYHPPRLDYPPWEDLDWLANHSFPAYLLADLNCHHRSFPHHSRLSVGSKRFIYGEIIYKLWISTQRLNRIGPPFPTYIMGTSKGTAPDIVLTNNKTFFNHHMTPLETNTSDHIGIKFTVSCRPITKTIKCENLKATDWDSFTAYHEANSDKTKLWNATAKTVTDALGDFAKHLIDARHKFVPQTKTCTRPFVPTSLRFNRLSRVLNTLNTNYLATDGLAIRTFIRRQRSVVGQLLREEGRLLQDDYWTGLINKAASHLSSDPKKYWRTFRQLSGSSKGVIAITNNGLPTGERLVSDRDKESSLRRAFAPRFGSDNLDKIAPDSRETMEAFFEEHPGALEPYQTADFSRFVGEPEYSCLITPDEVWGYISKGASNAPGEDGIVKEHLRHISQVMLVHLAHIFSACLALGIFPDSMKCALMIFIPKPGKLKCDPTNYRPISLLSVLGKIFEKILTNRLTLHMDDHNLHHKHQYGFRRGRGTVSALAMSYEWIVRQKAVKHSRVTMVARDIKGAFDFLPHRRIKYHLLAIGLPPMLLKSLSSFLDNRTAKIKVGSVIGLPFPLISGSPQGAGPSAALFNLCVCNSPSPNNPRQYWA